MSPGQSGGEEEMEERRSKLQLSTQHLLKEAREKSRGWESHPAPELVELSFKKVTWRFLSGCWSVLLVFGFIKSVETSCETAP